MIFARFVSLCEPCLNFGFRCCPKQDRKNVVLRKDQLGTHRAYHLAHTRCVDFMKPSGLNSPDLILRSIAPAMRLEGWRLARASPAAILRDASHRPKGEGLLLWMRSEGLETIGFTETPHEVRSVRTVYGRMS